MKKHQRIKVDRDKIIEKAKFKVLKNPMLYPPVL